MVRHVLVAYDGSPSARHAVSFAQGLAEQTGARITLMRVLEPGVAPVSGYPVDSFEVRVRQPDLTQVEVARKQLDEAASTLGSTRVEKRVETGPVAEVLCEQARRLEADLIVVGARGLSTGGRWRLGSVSDRVVHHADRPVTVVH
jgi:nucleotide-binding universal stress UspA family protein